MSFARRRIDVSFRIAGPNGIPGATGNTLVASGLRVHATISKPGLVPGVAQVRIYGLPLSAMNQLSTIGMPRMSANGNEITIAAGDDRGTSVVFVGQINEAYADLNEAPNSPLVVHAQTGLLDQMRAVQPTSYKGSVDAVQVLAFLAQGASPALQLENNGVQGVMLANPYYPGTIGQQIEQVCRHGDIDFVIDGGVLAIWPRGGTRSGVVPLVSADTGLIGYPRYSQAHIAIDCEFNAQISPGRQVEVRSIITPASGLWAVQSVTHQIESEVPDGAWLTHAECWPPALFAAAQSQANSGGQGG